MASNVTVTITGHLADNPEPRVTTTGKLVTNFTVISNDRRYDRDRNEWVDAAKTVIRINCWGDLAQLAGDSLTKGCRVTVTGHRLTADPYLGKDAKPRAALELTADTVAVDLKGQSAQITRWTRNGASSVDATEPPF
ncbi:single-stranded DNA-binding protein [Nocardia sp. NPDC051900]|uniref:single-stranded DNA-binding protein n=1 Tax=Nocardia sp. NPDC051900 TaxID=3364326 RepID=UPI0037AF8B5A